MKILSTITASLVFTSATLAISVNDPESAKQIDSLIEIENVRIVHTSKSRPSHFAKRNIIDYRLKVEIKNSKYHSLKLMDYYNALPKLQAWKKMSPEQRDICEMEKKILSKPHARNNSLRAIEDYGLLAYSKENAKYVVTALLEFLENYHNKIKANLPVEIEENNRQIEKLHEEKGKYLELKNKAEIGRDEEFKANFRGRESSREAVASLLSEVSFCNVALAEIEAQLMTTDKLIESSEDEDLAKELRLKKAELSIDYAGTKARGQQLKIEIDIIKKYINLYDQALEYNKKVEHIINEIKKLQRDNERKHRELEMLEPILSEDQYMTLSNVSAKVQEIVWREK